MKARIASLVMSLVLLLYPLSVGPAAKMVSVQASRQSWKVYFWIYAPVYWVAWKSEF